MIDILTLVGGFILGVIFRMITEIIKSDKENKLMVKANRELSAQRELDLQNNIKATLL